MRDSVLEVVSGPRWWCALVCVCAVVRMLLGHTLGCCLPSSCDWGQFPKQGGCMTASLPAPSQLCFCLGSDSGWQQIPVPVRLGVLLEGQGGGVGAGQGLLGLALKALSWVTEKSSYWLEGVGVPQAFPAQNLRASSPTSSSP